MRLVAYRAHVWLTHHPGERRVDLGTIEVTPKPEHELEVSFEYGVNRGGVLSIRSTPTIGRRGPGSSQIHVRLSEGQ